MPAYSLDFDPPAPFLSVTISPGADSLVKQRTGALLDTGADISVVPRHVVDALGLLPYAEMLIESFDGSRQRASLYAISLAFAGYRLSPVRVVAFHTDYAILGRDVLNQFLTVLDGPNQAFTMEMLQKKEEE